MPAHGTFTYSCDIDVIPGSPGIPEGATSVTNTVTVTATPAGGAEVDLTDSVTAQLTS